MARTHTKALQSRDANSKTNRPSSYILSRDRFLTKCIPLHQATMKGDWNAAKPIIDSDPTLLKCPITEGGETALHIAAAGKQVMFAKKLVEIMNRSDLDIKNNIGNTPLFFAAVTGTLEIAQTMVEKNDMLPMVRGCDGAMPLYMAAILGHRNVAEYLYPLSDIQAWNCDSKVDLLNICIASDLYDLALKMTEDDKQLAVAQDKNRETPLHVLARKPSAFSTEKEQGLWTRIILQCLRKFLKHLKFRKLGSTMIYKMIYEKSLSNCAALKLLQCLWRHTLQQEDLEIPDLPNDTSKLLFIATEYGNVDFVVELLRSYPDFIWKVDTQNRSIFHTAVMHRHESIYSLIYEIGAVKDLIATYRDNSNNNILHLAAALSPVNQLNGITGAALQMHRELLWYKEVEKIVQPSYRTMENVNRETPAMIFSKEHKELLEEGKKWMRETAQSLMIVSLLIATIVFASSSTIPTGNINAKGRPIFLNKNLVTIYSVSQATTMCFSSISVLMLSSILTSHFKESDFLLSLPLRLVTGLVTLFVSICGMTVAFCTILILSSGDGLVHGVVVYGTLASVPLMFVLLKYSVVMSIVSAIYRSKYLFCSHKRLL